MKRNEEYLYHFKDFFGTLYGRNEWINVKHCTSIDNWKERIIKLIKTIDKAIKSSVEVLEISFEEEIKKLISNEIKYIKQKEYQEIEELTGDLSVCLAKIIFTLLGEIPDNYRLKQNVSLRNSWKLNSTRTIQIIQNKKQKSAMIHKKFKAKELELFSNEYKKINPSDDFFTWIIKNKM